MRSEICSRCERAIAIEVCPTCQGSGYGYFSCPTCRNTGQVIVDEAAKLRKQLDKAEALLKAGVVDQEADEWTQRVADYFDARVSDDES